MKRDDRTYLLGFDLGTTTSTCVLASAGIRKNSVSGRMEFYDYRIEKPPEVRFTPLTADDLIDLKTLSAYFDDWLPKVRRDLHGGAIVTGLTARKKNAGEIEKLLRKKLGNLVCATLEDPRLESWVSFMGSAHDLSCEHPEEVFLNLDIGGGTTNLAIGRAGKVEDTASYFVGARHFRFRPGTFELTHLSSHARELAPHAVIGKVLEVTPIVGEYVKILEGWARGVDQAPATLHQVGFVGKPLRPTAITFSGGVGELVYGKRKTKRTEYGDLGGELADAIRKSAVLGPHVKRFMPSNRGLATVVGLAIHNQEISGTSIYIAEGISPPFPQLPIIGRMGEGDDIDKSLAAGLTLQGGCCVQLQLADDSFTGLKSLAAKLRGVLQSSSGQGPFLFLVDKNVGKTLGNLITDWGKHPLPVLVLDEIPPREGRFIQIGSPRKGIVPVSFYGMS